MRPLANEFLTGATVRREEPFDELGHTWVAMADPEGNEFCLCAE